MEIIGLIPARGGSKSIKNKNITLLSGKPLINYTIKASKGSNLCDIYCSTDSAAIADIAIKNKCKVVSRPLEFSTDRSSMLSVIKHFRDYLNEHRIDYDGMMVLYPTYPLRDSQLINEAIGKFNSNYSIIGLHNTRTHPYLCYSKNSDGILSQILEFDIDSKYRRQDYPEIYEISHVICMIPKGIEDTLNNQLFNSNTRAFIIRDESKVLNIDSPTDLKYGEFLLGLKQYE